MLYSGTHMATVDMIRLTCAEIPMEMREFQKRIFLHLTHNPVYLLCSQMRRRRWNGHDPVSAGQPSKASYSSCQSHRNAAGRVLRLASAHHSVHREWVHLRRRLHQRGARLSPHAVQSRRLSSAVHQPRRQLLPLLPHRAQVPPRTGRHVDRLSTSRCRALRPPAVFSETNTDHRHWESHDRHCPTRWLRAVSKTERNSAENEQEVKLSLG